MDATLHHQFNNSPRRVSTHGARRCDGSATVASERRGSGFLSQLRRLSFRGLAGTPSLLLPANPRSQIVPAFVLLKGGRGDVESLAASERRTAALRRVNARVLS